MVARQSAPQPFLGMGNNTDHPPPQQWYGQQQQHSHSQGFPPAEDGDFTAARAGAGGDVKSNETHLQFPNKITQGK